MSTQLQAIYENGLFRPLERVELPDNQRVTITVDPPAEESEGQDQAMFRLSPVQWQSFCDALDAPPRVIPALRQLLTEPSLFDDHGKTAT